MVAADAQPWAGGLVPCCHMIGEDGIVKIVEMIKMKKPNHGLVPKWF